MIIKKITVRRIEGSSILDEYKIIKIVGSVLCYGRGASYRVNDRLDEKQVEELTFTKFQELTVVEG